MLKDQTQLIRQQRCQDFSLSSQKQKLPWMLSIITNKVVDHAFSKILCWEQQCQIQIQSQHFVRHYDLQCEGAFILQGIFRKKLQNLLLKSFQAIKETLKINYLRIDYGNNKNAKSLGNSRASKSYSRISRNFDSKSNLSKESRYKRQFYGDLVTPQKLNFSEQQSEKRNTFYNSNNSFTEKKFNNAQYCYNPSNGSMVIRQKSNSYKQSLKRLLEDAKATNEQEQKNVKNIKIDDISSIPFRSRERLIFENPQKTTQETYYQYSKKFKESSRTLNMPNERKRDRELPYQKSENFEDENNISNLIARLKRNRQQRRKSKWNLGYQNQNGAKHYSNLGYEISPTECQKNPINNCEPYALNNIWSRDSLSIPAKYDFCVKHIYCCVHGRH